MFRGIFGSTTEMSGFSEAINSSCSCGERKNSGTSVNPARSLGPALFVGGEALASVWVFILAPLVGGALAAVVYKALDA